MSAWKKVKIGDFLTESKVIAENSDADHRITVRLNCNGVEKRGLKAEKDGATKYYTRSAGQFIYGKQNIHKGAFGIIPDELDGFTSSADLPAFDVDTTKCIPEWICLCLQVGERYRTLQKEVKGVGSQRLAVNTFLAVEIPLPEVSVQKKIVQSVSEKLENVRQITDELEKQKTYAKQLRQNILQEAIEGKLTADWREQHPVQNGNPDYDAAALLARIQEEKAKQNAKGGKQKKTEVAPVKATEQPFAIPDGWKWMRLGEVIKSVPRNGYSPKSVDYETPIKTLKLGAVTYGIFDPTECKYIDEEISEDAYCWLKNGDILIERSNSLEYVGMCAIYTGKDNEFMYPDLLMRFHVVDGVSTEYIHKALIAPFSRTYFMSNAKGAQKTMPKINQDCVINALIPLPPLAEQKEIVARAEAKLQAVTALQEQITEREELTKQLMQGILKEAFEEE